MTERVSGAFIVSGSTYLAIASEVELRKSIADERERHV